MTIVIIVLLVLLALWAFTHFYLRGADLQQFDATPGQWLAKSSTASPENATVIKMVGDMLSAATTRGQASGHKLKALRDVIDELGDSADLAGIRLLPADAAGVPGEWLLADGADPNRRLLYIHGGAWMMGSPKSHRCITTKLARVTGAAVLVIDYRLVPEHARLACLEDCQTAYCWILDNGPEGQAPVQQLFIAGDSAGGNLTLITTAWARDAGLRAVDAAIALSPATDGTLTGTSLKANLATDAMLGPMFGFLTRIPLWVVHWTFWLKYFIRPCDPRVSPLHHALDKLPPTLIHASEAEMLLDDARRYVNKAVAAGSPVSLETWPHMVHVWHFFEPVLPEAKDAFEHIGRFIEQYAPQRGR